MKRRNYIPISKSREENITKSCIDVVSCKVKCGPTTDPAPAEEGRRKDFVIDIGRRASRLKEVSGRKWGDTYSSRQSCENCECIRTTKAIQEKMWVERYIRAKGWFIVSSITGSAKSAVGEIEARSCAVPPHTPPQSCKDAAKTLFDWGP